jgi:hypothetical protein
MAEETRLYVVKNTSEQPISDSWDGKVYTFTPGDKVTVVMGVAIHFLEKYPGALVRVDEKVGTAPETIYTEVRLRNTSDEKDDVLTIGWDGRSYVFPPGEVVAVEASLARTLVERARGQQRPSDGKPFSLEVETNAAVNPPSEQEAPEAPETPKPARRLRKTRKQAEAPVE